MVHDRPNLIHNRSVVSLSDRILLRRIWLRSCDDDAVLFKLVRQSLVEVFTTVVTSDFFYLSIVEAFDQGPIVTPLLYGLIFSLNQINDSEPCVLIDKGQ